MEKGFMLVIYGAQNEKARKFYREKPSSDEITSLLNSTHGGITAVITECEYMINQHAAC